MDFSAIKELAKYAIKGTTPVSGEYSCDIQDVEGALYQELNSLAGDFNSWRRNKLDVFEILEEAYDEIYPKKILDKFGGFAEVRTFADGAKVVFKVKKGKNRGKRFVTKAAPSGRYEAFRLDSTSFTMETFAVGGSTVVDFERYLCGDESLVENTQVLLEGFDDYIYRSIQEALMAVLDNAKAPAANRATVSGFNATAMLGLISTVKAYGNGAVIFAPTEFVQAMGADVIVTPVTSGTPIVAQDDIDAIHKTGTIKMFRGTPIVELQNSFTDETNTHTVLNPQYAYIFPTGGEKVVKIGLEGGMHMREFQNRDNSFEVQAYRKIGVAITSYHNWAVYRNSSITSTYEG